MQNRKKTIVVIFSCVVAMAVLIVGLFFLKQSSNIRKSVEYLKGRSTEFTVSSGNTDWSITNVVKYDKSAGAITVSFYISHLDGIMAIGGEYGTKKARWTARDLANDYHWQIKKRYGVNIPVKVEYVDADSRYICIEEKSND